MEPVNPNQLDSNFNKTFIIRKATAKDVLSIARVHVDSWWETYKNIVPDNYLYSLKYSDRAQFWTNRIPHVDKKSSTLVITREDGDVIGFVDFGLAREHEHGFLGEIYSFYLLKKYHGNGFGKKLFLEAIKEFKNLGISSFYLWVLTNNPHKQFYSKLGGEYLKSQPIEIGEVNLVEDLIFFEKF